LLAGVSVFLEVTTDTCVGGLEFIVTEPWSIYWSLCARVVCLLGVCIACAYVPVLGTESGA
jgi:hypothetical protein